MKDGARVDVDEYSKDDPRDFVLWKASKPGEPSWDFGTGPGRPGWHIECSAMALRLLGEPPIDIHAGGVDLIFPHHENEIAQSEGATNEPFARFWVHVEHLFVENEKMSKSLGNVYTLAEIAARGHRPSALRYLLLSSHYRKQLNFTWAGMDQAEEALRRIVDFLARLDDCRRATGTASARARVGQTRRARRFRAALRARSQYRGRAGGGLRSGPRRECSHRRPGDLGGRRGSGPAGDRRFRPGARGRQPAPGGRRAAAGAGRGDRAA